MGELQQQWLEYGALSQLPGKEEKISDNDVEKKNNLNGQKEDFFTFIELGQRFLSLLGTKVPSLATFVSFCLFLFFTEKNSMQVSLCGARGLHS